NLPPGSNGNIADPLANSDQDRVTLASQTIYFEFDRSAIRTSEQSKLDQVATYLKSTAGVQLLIEGNCDERGTSEYNRALGERRVTGGRDSPTKKQAMNPGRITTLRRGKHKPVELGKTEEAYAKNRRDDFVILKPRQ